MARYFTHEESEFLKDCPNHKFVPTTLPAVKRIIAIGDVHGDFNLVVKSFKLAGLINDQFDWIANPPNTVVVQVGDQIDSCRPSIMNECQNIRHHNDKADDVKIIHFFDDISKKASLVGGSVYSLLGNHELMNSQNNFQYVSYENYHNFEYIDKNGTIYRGPLGRKNAFEPGGPLAREMACNRVSVLIIGSTLFVHAGILPNLTNVDNLNIDNRKKLEYLNALVRKWLLKNLSEKDFHNSLSFINDLNSPFWTRFYGMIPQNLDINSGDCLAIVKKTLQVYKIGHIVVGHTPQMFSNNNGINGTCYELKDNKLYRIDGGFSKAFDIFGKQRFIQILEILDDRIFNIIGETI